MRKAFTLVEVLVATTIGFTVMTVALLMLYAVTRTYRSTDIKNTVSEDFRELTRLMVEQGDLSNGYFIYKTFDTVADRDSASDVIGSGDSGDFVVFIYYSMADIKTSPNYQRVSRIVGFYRTQTSDPTVSQIRYFDSLKHNWGQAFSVANPATLAMDGTGVEALLPKPKSTSTSDQAAYSSVVSQFPTLTFQAMGTAADDSDALRLFYNINGKCMSISGMVVRKQTASGGVAVNYKSQNAFNLTISPRSAN